MTNLFILVLAASATASLVLSSCSASGRFALHDGIFSTSSVDQTPNASSWRLKKVDIGQGYGITRYYFYDISHGYGVAYKDRRLLIYCTSDGGSSWQKRSELDGVTINDLAFPSIDRGFVVGKCPAPDGDQSVGCILNSDDGGSTWKMSFSHADYTINKIAFESDETGVAIGTAENSAYVNADVVLFSRDHGQNWVDRSSTLRSVKSGKASGEVKSLTSIFLTDGATMLLSIRGDIFESRDKGQTWLVKDSVPQKGGEMAFSRFGYDVESGYWAAGGTMAIEGKGSVVATRTNSSWNVNYLKNYFFSDTQLISSKEFLATAVYYRSPDHKENAILFSSDNGNTWSTLIGGTDTNTNGSIFVFSPQHVLVVSSDGSGLLLERD